MNVRIPYRCICLSLLLGGSAAQAQIVTDGSVGPPVSLGGPEMTIGAELGSTRGANLFHSFQRFDIPTGHQATFTGPDQIRNVIGRVTGDQTSRIDGTLRSTVGQADVYLINPSGVVMGPNARVDVPAALHLSTADEVRFSDGSRYSARDPSNSSLTLAAPESFGFLSPQPASLTIAGSQLALKPGKTATLSGGDVQITGSEPQAAVLSVPGGEIRLETFGAAGGVMPIASPSPAAGGGRLAIERALIDTTGDGGGRISVRAGEADLNQTWMFADNAGATDAAGGVDIVVGGRLQLRDLTGITSDVLSTGDAGSVSVSAGLLEISNGSWISSSTLSDGDAGDVSISANALYLDGRGSENLTGIGSEARAESFGQAGTVRIAVTGDMHVRDGALVFDRTFGSGDAGSLFVQAGRLHIDDAGLISQAGSWSETPDPDFDVLSDLAFSQLQADPGSVGRAGDIEVRVSERLELTNKGTIASTTFATGRAGDVRVQAGELAMYPGETDPNDFFVLQGISSTADWGATGDGGDVRVDVSGQARLEGLSSISAGTGGSGNAGSVWFSADSLSIDCGVYITDLPVWPSGVRSDNSGGTGDAGNVTLEISNRLEILNGGQISSSNFGSGDAGTVRVRAGELLIDSHLTLESLSADTGFSPLLVDSDEPMILGFTGILTDADRPVFAPDSQTGLGGNAGNVILDVLGRMEMHNETEISSTTWGSGNAGTILVRAAELDLDSRASIGSNSSVLETPGNAGDIRIEVAGRLQLTEGAGISGSTYSTGRASTVVVQAGTLRLDDASIASTSGQYVTSEAGIIRVEVDGMLSLENDSRIATDTLSAGDAGTVTALADALRLLSGSEISSAADRDATGQVGTVDIQVRDLSIEDGARISIEARQIQTDAPEISDAAGIRLMAERLSLDQGAITAESTGRVPAGVIQIQANDLRLINAGRITTEATQDQAGPITISGGRLWLTDSLITTSAFGETGNGGDITLTPEYLILDGGFIQANTAMGARGGDIRIDSRALITSENQVEIGGAVRRTFTTDSDRNIIQAAAPGGEQGTIAVSSPDLDITAALVPLATAFDDPDDLLTDLCQNLGGSAASSLIERGAGGLPPAPQTPASVSFMGTRLDRIGAP
jgi:filamentous hemagglutinin family protein